MESGNPKEGGAQAGATPAERRKIFSSPGDDPANENSPQLSQ